MNIYENLVEEISIKKLTNKIVIEKLTKANQLLADENKGFRTMLLERGVNCGNCEYFGYCKLTRDSNIIKEMYVCVLHKKRGEKDDL